MSCEELQVQAGLTAASKWQGGAAVIVETAEELGLHVKGEPSYHLIFFPPPEISP